MDKSKFKDKKEWQKFSMELSILFLAIAIIELVRGRESYLYFVIAGIIIILIGLACPIIIKPFYILFSYVGFYLGKFTNKLILFVFFYIFLTPWSFLLKLFGINFLDFKIEKEKEKDSYWLKREITKFKKEDFKNQF